MSEGQGHENGTENDDETRSQVVPPSDHETERKKEISTESSVTVFSNSNSSNTSMEVVDNNKSMEKDDLVEQSDEPKEEPKVESAEEPKVESAEEPIEESAEESKEESAEEPIEEPAAESKEESAGEPIEESAEEPIEETAAESKEESAEEPTVGQEEEPKEESAEEPADDPREEPPDEATKDPTEDSTEEPQEDPIEEPEEEPTNEPTVEPSEEVPEKAEEPNQVVESNNSTPKPSCTTLPNNYNAKPNHSSSMDAERKNDKAIHPTIDTTIIKENVEAKRHTRPPPPSDDARTIKKSSSIDKTKINARRKTSTKSKRENVSVNVTVPSAPFESGVNTECIQLLRQLWNVHEEAVEFLEQLRCALCHFRQELRSEENDFETTIKEKKLSSAFSIAKKNSEIPSVDRPELTDRWVPLQPFIDGLKCICDNVSEIEKQFVAISVFQSQCKLVLYAKIRHAKQQLTHDRLSILHGVSHLIQATLQLLSSPPLWTPTKEEKTSQLMFNVFQLTEVYNWCLEASWTEPLEAVLAATSASVCTTPSDIDSGAETGASTTPSKIRVLVQVKAANRDDSSLLRLSLKPLPATRLLQIVGQKRATFASIMFARLTQQNFYASGSSGVLTSVEKYEHSFNDEDSRLGSLAKGFSQCPSLLGRAAVKKSENGDQRLTRSARTKMYSYFHEVLWTLVGEFSEDLLLWGLHSAVPLVLQPLDTFIAFRNSLSLGKLIQESNISPMLSAFDSVGGALNSFSLLASWDEKMRDGFETASKVKRPEQVVLVSNPEPSQWATDIGAKFGQIVATCISLIDGGNNAASTSERMRLAGFAEEEPLGDEAQTLFRLEVTLVYFKAWIVKRCKVWLNGWAIPQFLACSQREPALLVQLVKSRESILITREILLTSDNISIRLSANHRQMCADDLKAAIQQLQLMPEELLMTVGPVCRTLSLATLQSYMPASSHWRGVGPGSGLDPDKPSSYVQVFVDRVIEPVTTAAVELVPGPVQEAMGKQVIHAACDAWLQYILQKRIRFSEWGAVQLLRDFISLRDWIRNETLLENEARKSILQLEVLKRCEGVAYLLLRSPGDVLGVGKPSRRSRRVAPSSESVGSSPSLSENSVAEDDIPPEMYVPNQQMWLELRLRRGVLSPCCS